VPGKPEKKRGHKNDLAPDLAAGWRLWLFRVAALTIIAALLFVCLEIALRVAGYGFPATATVKCKLNGQDAYCDNVKFSWRFFPPPIAREFGFCAKSPLCTCNLGADMYLEAVFWTREQ
jgi:hypothetical protein